MSSEAATPASQSMEDPDFSHLPTPLPFTAQHDGKTWSLDIIGGQQPDRARACGFGDKDRRPISPPPCVRLIIKDIRTGKEVDYTKIDLSYFVLTVDLWDQNADKEANLVKHTTNSPAISSVQTAAYPRTISHSPLVSSQPAPTPTQPYSASSHSPYSSDAYASPLSAHPGSARSYDQRSSYSSGYTNGGAQYSPAPPDYRYGSMPHGSNGYPQQIPPISALSSHSGDYNPSYGQGSVSSTSNAQGMFTRNLIGNTSASAFLLQNLQSESGIWFVLQDLSVRTEGYFRLKFNFVNVRSTTSEDDSSNNLGSDVDNNVVSVGGTAPFLASAFSKVFKVWSAKKFPGVVESTPLSRKFADQGIKIPIRKEGKEKSKRKRGRDDEDESDGDEDD